MYVLCLISYKPELMNSIQCNSKSFPFCNLRSHNHDKEAEHEITKSK